MTDKSLKKTYYHSMLKSFGTLSMPILPIYQHSFDERLFFNLLATSVSFSKEEKKRIIEGVPKLSTNKIEKLIEALEDEYKIHNDTLESVDDVAKHEFYELQKTRLLEWQNLSDELFNFKVVKEHFRGSDKGKLEDYKNIIEALQNEFSKVKKENDDLKKNIEQQKTDYRRLKKENRYLGGMVEAMNKKQDHETQFSSLLTDLK